MPSPKRRAKRRREALTFAERWFLLTGSGDPFDSADDAYLAWISHRDELLPRHDPEITAFAAYAFDGDTRPFSRYQHLWPEALLCHRQNVARRLNSGLSPSVRRPSSMPASTAIQATSSPPSGTSTTG